MNDLLALSTERRLELWWILKLFEVELVCAVVHVHLCHYVCATDFARLPISLMPLREMARTQRKPAMISRTAVVGIRKHDVFVFVITDPLVATFRPNQLPCLMT